MSSCKDFSSISDCVCIVSVFSSSGTYTISYQKFSNNKPNLSPLLNVTVSP